MNFKFHPNKIEIRVLSERGKNVEEISNKCSSTMKEEVETSEEEGAIMVPAIEMRGGDDSNENDDSKNFVNVKLKENIILDERVNSVAAKGSDEKVNLAREGKNSVENQRPREEKGWDKSRKKIKKGGDAAFRCDLCGSGFRIKHSITKHKRVVHGMHQFRCMFCDRSYPLKRNLLDHIPTHGGPLGFKCEICNKVRPNYISLKRHFKTHGRKSIPCTKCGAWFKTNWELKSHVIQHGEGRKFSCDFCKLEFSNPSKLREHVTGRHSREKPFKCEICGKEFNARGNLTNHIKLHLEEKPFKCQYCGLSFPSNSARKKHIPVHEGEKRKPYECEECNKKYTSTTSLAVHRMKFHSGDRVFHCHYCREKFRSRSAVAEHGAKHAVERPYSCPKCLCRYKNKRELRRHQREKEHFDPTESESVGSPVPGSKEMPDERVRTSGGAIEVAEAAAAAEEEEEDDDYWEIPEPEVCIKVADSDEGEIESILPD